MIYVVGGLLAAWGFLVVVWGAFEARRELRESRTLRAQVARVFASAIRRVR